MLVARAALDQTIAAVAGRTLCCDKTGKHPRRWCNAVQRLKVRAKTEAIEYIGKNCTASVDIKNFSILGIYGYYSVNRR